MGNSLSTKRIYLKLMILIFFQRSVSPSSFMGLTSIVVPEVETKVVVVSRTEGGFGNGGSAGLVLTFDGVQSVALDPKYFYRNFQNKHLILVIYDFFWRSSGL